MDCTMVHQYISFQCEYSCTGNMYSEVPEVLTYLLLRNIPFLDSVVISEVIIFFLLQNTSFTYRILIPKVNSFIIFTPTGR